MTIDVSIIMATYNREHFIVEAIHSIQNQSFENFECLIIDDGGTDNTLDVLTPILKKDQRFKYFIRPEKYKKGLPGSRNYGLDLSKGEYIVFFDDDDYIHSKNLEINTKVLKNKNIDFCSYQKQPFFNKIPHENNDEIKITQTISYNNLFEIITGEISIASCTVFWKKLCFENIRFVEDLMYAEEWECYTRIISNKKNGVQIDNVLYYNRKHEQSNTGEYHSNNTIRRKSKSDAVILIVKNLESKKLLSFSILRYFLQISDYFRDFNLFQSILNESKISFPSKIYWNIFYAFLPYRKKITKLKKSYN